MANLREAAQALLAVLNRGTYLDAGLGSPLAEEFYAAWNRLADALALPEAGWEAGAEAMRAKIAERFHRGADSLKDADREYEMRLIAVEIASIPLPVPSATTGAPQPERARLYDAEAWDGAMDALGKMRERAERAEALARSVGTLNAAPEAKPAESESRTARVLLMGLAKVVRTPMLKVGTRVRITVEPEPSPVEPEETP